MLYREIIAVCSQIHTKHTNTLCGQNVELLNVKPGGTYSDHCAVHIVTSRLYIFVFYRLTVYVLSWEYNIKIIFKKDRVNNWTGWNWLRSDCCKTFIAICCDSSDSRTQTTRRHSHHTSVSLDTALKKLKFACFKKTGNPICNSLDSEFDQIRRVFKQSDDALWRPNSTWVG